MRSRIAFSLRLGMLFASRPQFLRSRETFKNETGPGVNHEDSFCSLPNHAPRYSILVRVHRIGFSGAGAKPTAEVH
jgi:hypothetical protein